MREAINTAVLVIDDEEIVRNNIEEILVPPSHNPESDTINRAVDILFDQSQPILAPKKSSMPAFTVDKAANGMEGLELVRNAVTKGHPYAVIFLDMRMPGWDGLETATHIRKYDNKAEIIFVTAFSDRSIEEIVSLAGQNIGYHCKPYASEEIVQLATKGVTDYNKLRNLEQLISIISSINLNQQQLTYLLKNILDQLASYVDTDMALMGKLHDDNTYEKIFSIGALEEKINLDELIDKVKSLSLQEGEVMQLEEIVLAKMENYTVFAALKKNEKLVTEKLYLLKLFIQSAAKAIQNAQLHQQLIQNEKLSAIGNAMSMVMHDLRSPIKNIPTLTGFLREEGINSQWMSMIDECAFQASEIFDDFIDFIKDAKVKKEPLDLADLVQKSIQVTDTANMLFGIKVNIDIPAGLTLMGDESKLKRAVINIVNNAAEALTENNIADPCIDITAAKKMDHIELIIKDNGLGVPVDIIKILFEPFVTKDKDNGTGLGLAIVKQYILAHGGSINVENDNGAVFKIMLPYDRSIESSNSIKTL